MCCLRLWLASCQMSCCIKDTLGARGIFSQGPRQHYTHRMQRQSPGSLPPTRVALSRTFENNSPGIQGYNFEDGVVVQIGYKIKGVHFGISPRGFMINRFEEVKLQLFLFCFVFFYLNENCYLVFCMTKLGRHLSSIDCSFEVQITVVFRKGLCIELGNAYLA